VSSTRNSLFFFVIYFTVHSGHFNFNIYFLEWLHNWQLLKKASAPGVNK
jgi:hypothetical protein